MRVPAFGEGFGVEAKPPVVAPREAANRVYVCFSAASRRTRLNRNPSQMSGTTDHFKPSIVANGVLSTVANYFPQQELIQPRHRLEAYATLGSSS